MVLIIDERLKILIFQKKKRCEVKNSGNIEQLIEQEGDKGQL